MEIYSVFSRTNQALKLSISQRKNQLSDDLFHGMIRAENKFYLTNLEKTEAGGIGSRGCDGRHRENSYTWIFPGQR